MKLTISCATCQAVLSEVEKDEITDADKDMYRAITTCVNCVVADGYGSLLLTEE